MDGVLQGFGGFARRLFCGLDGLLSGFQAIRDFDEAGVSNLKCVQRGALSFKRLGSALAFRLGPGKGICGRSAGSFPKLMDGLLVLSEAGNR